MKSTFKNFALAFAVFTFVFILGTCGVKQLKKDDVKQTDTTTLNSLKNKVSELELQYRFQINKLVKSKDSLRKQFEKSKMILRKVKANSKVKEESLVTILDKDTSSYVVDSIKPLTLQYIAIQIEKDSICNESIRILEVVGTKQDSIINLKNKELINLNDLNKIYSLRELTLTEQLNTAYKAQRKAVLKAKVFKGMALLLTGISGALIINQTLK